MFLLRISELAVLIFLLRKSYSRFGENLLKLQEMEWLECEAFAQNTEKKEESFFFILMGHFINC